MNESSPPSELDVVGRIGQLVILLSDIRDHFLGIEKFCIFDSSYMNLTIDAKKLMITK